MTGDTSVVDPDTRADAPATSAHGGRDRGPRPLRSVVGPRLRDGSVVVALLVVLEVVALHGWLSGSAAPQWDFYNQYNTEAWAWWRDGGPTSPAQWMPYAWGGYPALLDAQNSSWYLPVGLVAVLTPFTIQASAVLSAIHVAFGALGAYVLARSFGVRTPAALLGLVAWFFAAGFYSNASHLDITRAYAWMPWLVLVIGSTWRWDRWWRWLLAGLVLWQGLLSLYPGIVVACVYVGAAYVIATQVVHRPRFRSYLLPLAVVTASAAAMTALRYLPLFLTRGAGTPSGSDASEFPLRMVGAFLYPYANETLLNDITMRSFFLAAPVFALLAFLPWASRRVVPVVALVVVAAVMGLPVWPWHDALRSLPGMSLSRFTMSDFKPLLLVGLLLIAVLIADSLAGPLRDGLATRRRSTRLLVAAGLTVGVVAVFLTAGLRGAYDDAWVAQFLLLLVSVVAVWAGALRPAAATGGLAVLIALAGASGLLSTLSTPAPWTSDRRAVETASFGASVDSLISRYPAVPAGAPQRPARLAPEGVAQPEQALSIVWGRAFYTGESSVMGYVNLKGSAAFDQMNEDLLTGGEREEALAFWAASGMLVADDGTGFPTSATTARCAGDGACGAGLEVVPEEYAAGHLSYTVSAASETTVSANEAFYPGWHVRACAVGAPADGCRDLSVSAGAHSQVSFVLPAGDWSVELDYRLPGQSASFLAAAAGAAVLLGAAVLVEVARRRRRVESDSPVGEDAPR